MVVVVGAIDWIRVVSGNAIERLTSTCLLCRIVAPDTISARGQASNLLSEESVFTG